MAKQERAAWFKVFLHHKPFINEMTDEELGRAYRTAMEYFDNRTELPLERTERFLFLMMKEHIDEAIADYETKKENGKKGGRPKNQNKPEVISGSLEEANETEADADTDTEADADAKADTDTEEKREKERKKRVCSSGTPAPFVPPQLDEVTDYVRECEYQMDPTAFWDYYTANGWRIGNAPILDWKAALRNWNRKERPKNKTRYEPEIPQWKIGVCL